MLFNCGGCEGTKSNDESNSITGRENLLWRRRRRRRRSRRRREEEQAHHGVRRRRRRYWYDVGLGRLAESQFFHIIKSVWQGYDLLYK